MSMVRRLTLASLACSGLAKVLDVRDFGARHTQAAGSKEDLAGNAAAVDKALAAAAPGDTVWVPKDPSGPLWTTGGIQGVGLFNVTLLVEGDWRAGGGWDGWPIGALAGRGLSDDLGASEGAFNGGYLPFIHIMHSRYVTITGGGEIDGMGAVWWNRYIIKPLPAQRPKLIILTNISDLLVHHVNFRNSPSFHLDIDDCSRVEIHHCNVTVDRKIPVWDPKLQPEDLNTDGFDLSGKDIWVHHCYIQNDDDSIAVKPCGAGCIASNCTENLLIEDTTLIGFGASIGSVPPGVPAAGQEFGHCVRNVTFRRISMPGTGKGVYVKSNPSCQRDGSVNALIQDILYEDMDIPKPVWWAVWIGPQQQHEPGEALGEKCPLTYPIEKPCPTQGCVTFRNITLRRVTITDPVLSPGVILGNASNPMDVRFEGVTVKYTGPMTGRIPYGRNYQCLNTHLTVDPASSPVPHCAHGLEAELESSELVV